MKEGIVKIHGREYKTVALRVSEFRAEYPIEKGWSISTELLYQDEAKVIVKAIVAHGNEPRGSGHAEEYRDASKINRTSALEVAETSAIGRALAAIGLAGTEYASANEVLTAIAAQDKIAALKDAVVTYAPEIALIKESIECGDLATGSHAWFDGIDIDGKDALWHAPSKSELAPFTTDEREVMKTTEFRESNNGEHRERGELG